VSSLPGVRGSRLNNDVGQPSADRMSRVLKSTGVALACS
jgi:hypothetical protein